MTEAENTTDTAGDWADTLAHEILGAHCGCYAEAWPGHTCANECAEVAAKIRAASAGALGRTVLAERERCAQIADDYDQSPGDDSPMGPVMAGQVAIAQTIAAKIRGEPTLPKVPARDQDRTDLREAVAAACFGDRETSLSRAGRVLAAIRNAGFEIHRVPTSNPCCFDIPGSDRVRGFDEPCRVCPERGASARGTTL